MAAPARLPKWPTTLALFAALAGPPLLVLVGDRLVRRSNLLDQFVVEILYWALAAFVVWVVIGKERPPLRSIGIRRPTWSTLVSVVVLGAITWYVLPVVTAPLLNVLETTGLETRLRAVARLPVWFRVILAGTGGFIEEILYRRSGAGCHPRAPFGGF